MNPYLSASTGLLLLLINRKFMPSIEVAISNTKTSDQWPHPANLVSRRFLSVRSLLSPHLRGRLHQHQPVDQFFRMHVGRHRLHRRRGGLHRLTPEEAIPGVFVRIAAGDEPLHVDGGVTAELAALLLLGILRVRQVHHRTGDAFHVHRRGDHQCLRALKTVKDHPAADPARLNVLAVHLATDPRAVGPARFAYGQLAHALVLNQQLALVGQPAPDVQPRANGD